MSTDPEREVGRDVRAETVAAFIEAFHAIGLVDTSDNTVPDYRDLADADTAPVWIPVEDMAGRLADVFGTGSSGDVPTGRTDDRLVVKVNKDANMSRGKHAAQAVHAALNLVDAHPRCPVIVLGAPRREIAGMPVQVRDAGLTETEPGTLTAGAEWGQP